MRNAKLLVAALALGAAMIALPALSTAAKDKAATPLVAALDGKAEVPGPGDPNGKGSAQLDVRPAKRKVCFVLEVKKLDPLFAGHIHKGDEATAGPVKVTLFEDAEGIPGDGSYEGCVKKVSKRLLKKIANKPERFYVNLHNAEFPDGAIRGQLEPYVG